MFTWLRGAPETARKSVLSDGCSRRCDSSSTNPGGQKMPYLKKNGNPPRSNSEPHPNGLAGNLILVTEAAFPSLSPRDLLLRTQEVGQEGPLTLSPAGHALFSCPTPHRASDLGDTTVCLGPGHLCQAGRAGAQGLACPVHRADPARAGVSDLHIPTSGLAHGRSLPRLSRAPSLPALSMFSFLPSEAPQGYQVSLLQ